MILEWRIGRWTVELLTVNGLLFGFTLPERGMWSVTYGLNFGPLCICIWRPR